MNIRIPGIHIIVVLLTSMLLCSCSTSQQIYGGTHSLQDLKDLHVRSGKHPTGFINPIRLAALKEAGIGVGARSGLAFRARQINGILEKNDRQLRQLFDFQQMLLPHNVLPPILVESRAQLRLADPNTIRLADRSYRIVEQARFVTAAPQWREYLWMDFDFPVRPDPTLLPKNKYERAQWVKFVSQGWQRGIAQANEIYRENLSLIQRDFTGMALYRRLLTQQVVSAPYVARTALGVTGNADNVRINDQVLRITALPELSPDSAHWRPVLTDDE